MQHFERVTVPSPNTNTETETWGFQDQDQDQNCEVPRPRPRTRLVKTGLETSRDQDSSLENSKSVVNYQQMLYFSVRPTVDDAELKAQTT